MMRRRTVASTPNVITDSFTGVDGDAWNPRWSTKIAWPGSVAAIHNNRARIEIAAADTPTFTFEAYKQSVIDEMVGFARGAVTGGLHGDLYVVDSTANSGPGSLRDALSQGNRWIVFDRTVFPRNTETTIALSSVIDMRNIHNVTVDGFGARVRITGYGITTAAWTTTGATSVSNNLCFINLKFSNISSGNFDCLTIDGTDRAWFYHLDLSGGGDGNLDITHVHAGPNPHGLMSIQNCHIHQTQSGKGCLLGNQTIGQGDYVSPTSSYPASNGGDCRISIFRCRFNDQHRNPIVANYWVHIWNSYVHDWVNEGFAVMGLNGALRVEESVMNPGSAPAAHASKGLFAWTFSYPDNSRRYKRWSHHHNIYMTGANGTASVVDASGGYLNPSGSIFTIPYAYQFTPVTGDNGAGLIASLTSPSMSQQDRAGCVDRDGYFDLVGTPTTPGATTTFTPTVIPLSATEIPNPWRGQYIWNNNAPRPSGWPVQDTYGRFTWRQLESTQGNYTFGVIDSLLSDAQSRGGRGTVGVYSLYYGGPPSHYRAVPDYIADNPAAGTFDGNYFVPNWNSEPYLSRWEALMQAIADEYGDDLRFCGLDIRGYGNYGEWHEYDSPDYGGITDANARRLVEASVDAFSGTHVRLFALSAHIVAMEHALTLDPNIGVRADSLGANEMGGATWFMDRVVERGLVNPYERWKVAPFITEWPHQSVSNLFTVGYQHVQDYHISHLSSGNIHSSQPQQSTAFENANKVSGSRIVLSSVTVPTSVANGQAFELTSLWSNVNVAPPYDAFDVDFELRSGATVVWTGTSSLDLRTLLPTGGTPRAVDDVFTVTGVAPGSYVLCVKVPWQNNAGYLEPYRLAITGRTGDGAYPLGTVMVT